MGKGKARRADGYGSQSSHTAVRALLCSLSSSLKPCWCGGTWCSGGLTDSRLCSCPVANRSPSSVASQAGAPTAHPNPGLGAFHASPFRSSRTGRLQLRGEPGFGLVGLRGGHRCSAISPYSTLQGRPPPDPAPPPSERSPALRLAQHSPGSRRLRLRAPAPDIRRRLLSPGRLQRGAAARPWPRCGAVLGAAGRCQRAGGARGSRGCVDAGARRGLCGSGCRAEVPLQGMRMHALLAVSFIVIGFFFFPLAKRNRRALFASFSCCLCCLPHLLEAGQSWRPVACASHSCWCHLVQVMLVTRGELWCGCGYLQAWLAPGSVPTLSATPADPCCEGESRARE